MLFFQTIWLRRKSRDSLLVDLSQGLRHHLLRRKRGVWNHGFINGFFVRNLSNNRDWYQRFS